MIISVIYQHLEHVIVQASSLLIIAIEKGNKWLLIENDMMAWETQKNQLKRRTERRAR